MTGLFSTIALRDAQPEDVPAIVALVESAYRGDVSRTGWTTEADLLDGQRIDANGIAADLDRPLVLADAHGSQGFHRLDDG